MATLLTDRVEQAVFLVHNEAEIEFKWEGAHCTFVLVSSRINELVDAFASDGHNVNAKKFMQTYRAFMELMKASKNSR